MRRLVLGVIGHVDHGKTALVRALTGIETDRLPEERLRGISIALGFAHLATADAIVDLIDMPGHERFVRTMASGATGVDAALLVVAATEGVMPQTVEHVDIAALLGLRRVIVAVSKADLVDPAQIAVVAAAVSALLAEAGIELVATVATSATSGAGIADLREQIVALADAGREQEGVAFLPIDRAFTVAGHGTVVTGTLRGAPISTGDTLDLLPDGRGGRVQAVRVRAVHVRGVRVAQAAPGQRVAVNLRDVDLAAAKAGAALAAPGAMAASAWLTLRVRSVAGAPALPNGARLLALLGTQEVAVRLRLLDRDALEPGQTALAQLHCESPVAIPARAHVVLRVPSPPRTVAGGVVIEPEARRRRRHDKAALAGLAAMADASPMQVVLDGLVSAGVAGTTLGRLSRASGLSGAAVARVVAGADATVGRQHLVVAEGALAWVRERIPVVLAAHSAGLARERLAALLEGAGMGVLDEALRPLLASGGVREAQGLVALRRPEAERDRARVLAGLSSELERSLLEGGLTPPDAAALGGGGERQLVLDRLLKAGVIVRARDSGQKRDVLFHQAAIEEAQRRLLPLLSRPPGLSVSDVGAALGISRKYSVPLLEHLDQIRFTRRVQDRRVLGASVSRAPVG